MLNILKKKSKKFNCYSSIKELPVEIWFDIHSTGDLLLLFKDQKEAYLTDKLNDLFDKIYDEFLEIFGLSDEFLADLEERKEIALMKADVIIDNKRYLRTHIQIGEENLKFNKRVVKPTNLGETLAKLGKYYGYMLNEKITVYQYYSHINAIGKNG